MPEPFGGLVSYFEDFMPRHFPLPDGTPRSKRSGERIAKRYNLPLIRVNKVTYIDPIMAAQRLREIAMMPPRETPRRGRPPKVREAAQGPMGEAAP